MKIAQVFDVIYPYVVGGAQKRIWELSKRLSWRGHEVTIFGMKHWEGEDVIVVEGVRLWGVCPPQELFRGDRRCIKEAIYVAYKVIRPLLKEDFDIIDCSNFPYFPCFSAKLHTLTKGSTLVITWLEVWDDYWYEYLGRKGIFGKSIEKIVAGLSMNMIANSESTRRRLFSIGARGDIELVPNGIDIEEIDAVTLADDRSDVVFAGRLIKEKNIHLLISSIALIRQVIPNIRCTIIGDGPERDRLENLVCGSGLASNIRFLGHSESSSDVLSHMKASKVFVLPSSREGFGIVLLEANACGLPVITTKHPQNAACELVVDGKNGFLCELSEEDMAQKIMTALVRREDMSQSCIDHAREYDWNKMVDMIEGVYQSALGQK